MSEQAPINARDVDADFFLIWTKNGRNPRVSHRSLDAAQAEVRRLAERNPDKRFFILKSVERVWVNEAADRIRREEDFEIVQP